jgi:phenylpropionate dioxygenase-like ring-hydroxylating dioxygenase large terminal subunit
MRIVADSAEELTEKPARAPREEMLLDFWYPALRGARLKRGQMRRQILLNRPLLVGRDRRGAAFVLDDHCPHRGIPLTFGAFDGERIECCYHGWQFDCEGRCRHIPALLPDSPVKVERIRAKSYLSVERDGYIWVFMPGPLARKGMLPEVPRLPVFSEKYKQSAISRRLLCSVDHGIIGLMDPAHGPFVHQSFWWRSRQSIHAKSKKFEPIPNGFRMSTHQPSGNSAAYKLLKLYNEPVTTTIDFVLPGIRLEQVRCGPYWFSSQTVVTPITDQECRLDFQAAWNVFRWVPLIKPVFRLFAHLFVGQDQRIMEMQAVGLKDDPPLMLIDDADTQAKWYYRLKAAYLEAQRSGGPMDHPLKETVTLRWRS